jgi:Chaperone of endosialidase
LEEEAMKNIGLKEKIHVASLMALLVLTCGIVGHAQQAAPSGAVSVTVPRMMRFSGTVTDTRGKAMSGVAGITFSIYKEQQGGAALWMETQNVNLDSTGHYTTLLGSTKPEGLPQDLFTSGEARWVEVQVQEQPESRRVLLLSVPYALKAADAETVGGLPASAFVLAAPSNNVGNGPTSPASSASTQNVLTPGTITGSGTPGFLPDFTGAATIGNSAVFQSGTSPTARIGINTSTPTTNLDVNGGAAVRGTFSLPATGTATSASGKKSEPENLAASAFNSGTGAAVTQTFQLTAEPVGNNTATPSGSLNLLFGQGVSTPAETGLKISSKGILTFATGQPFPGAGTVKSVLSGAGLTGGPITNVGTLSIASAGVTNAMLANPSLTIHAGTDLLGGGLVSLGGSTTLNVDTSKVPQLNTPNTFTGNQTVNGNISAGAGNISAWNISAINTVTSGGGGYYIGPDLFAWGATQPYDNVLLGFTGNTSLQAGGGGGNTATGFRAFASDTLGYQNTSSGYYALNANTQGNQNVADGAQALALNTLGSNNTAIGHSALYGGTGNYNTAIGHSALYSNGTGNYNTAIGYQAGTVSLGGLTNATAIGALATVTASNSVVLGSIKGVQAAAADTNVGIGTTAPAARLHIGPANSTGLRIEGPNSAGTGTFAASLGGFGDFNIDAVGIVAGRFSVKENGHVNIGLVTVPRILSVGQFLGHPIADGWDTYSSRRWKTNIQTLNGALGKVEQLRGVSYDLKDSGKHQIGVIAEEVGAVVPEVVTWEKNGKDAQSVDYSRLTALLIEATKEQQTLICQQQQRIQAQEARLKIQQAQIGELTREVRAVRVALESGRRTGSDVRTAEADVSPTLQ